jgi:hypothetical protein
MLLPFFKLAAVSRARQSAFRYMVGAHLILLAASAGVLMTLQVPNSQILGHVALIAGIVEGALLLGWRLTQMPKSQALEFVLVSPLRPHQLFLGEALVGLSRLALLTFAGLPVYLLLALEGHIWATDVPALLVMPWTWGAIAGLSLATWAYENRLVRRWGERVMVVLIVAYLTVGVLAAEHLADWLSGLPKGISDCLLWGVRIIHVYSPFTVLRDVLQDPPEEIWGRFALMEVIALGLLALLLCRAASRLQGHFRDRHYLPIEDVSRQKRRPVGDRPLAWWAVKRVSEYSGRINLWLAGGFGLVYAAYTVAGPAWPDWLGTQVFATFELMGGVPVVATALVVLAAVPAAFQYGLWDSNAQDRARRLELLLMTSLDASDYWGAAAAAAWRRGRGYFAVAGLLWVSLLLAGRIDAAQFLAAIAASVLLWGVYFALGFRAFARGSQANSLGMVLTVGLPILVCLLCRGDFLALASLLPPGAVYVGGEAPNAAWLPGPLLAGAAALAIGQSTRQTCLQQLHDWFDRHHGGKKAD